MLPSHFILGCFYLALAIATTRYCRGVERIPEHTPVVIFVSCRVDSVMLDTDRDSQESDFAVSLGYVVVIFVIFRR